MGIELKKITKSFGEFQVLFDMTATIQDGEFVSLTGRSGSGKSTLLYVLSSLDSPSSGQVMIDGEDVAAFSSRALHEFRNQHMGFVFQFHYLLPELTALENVLMPAMKNGVLSSHREEAIHLLSLVGLSNRADRYPGQLSGGEQQRVAICRALLMKPKYLFADEPTGNLDSVNGQQVMEMLKTMNRELKTTIVMVTHDSGFAALASRQIQLVDGRIV